MTCRRHPHQTHQTLCNGGDLPQPGVKGADGRRSIADGRLCLGGERWQRRGAAEDAYLPLAHLPSVPLNILSVGSSICPSVRPSFSLVILPICSSVILLFLPVHFVLLTTCQSGLLPKLLSTLLTRCLFAPSISSSDHSVILPSYLTARKQAQLIYRSAFVGISLSTSDRWLMRQIPPGDSQIARTDIVSAATATSPTDAEKAAHALKTGSAGSPGHLGRQRSQDKCWNMSERRYARCRHDKRNVA